MGTWWPWIAVAGLGALHGLHPASGWPWVAAWGLRSCGVAPVWRALLPIGIGHAASLGLVALALAAGLSLDAERLLVLAGVLCVAAALLHLWGRQRHRAPAGQAGLALWSFMMSTGHGAGLALVPTLALCIGGDAPAASGSLSWTTALAVIGVHLVAMLAVTGLVAAGICRGVAVGAGWLTRHWRVTAQPVRAGLDGDCSGRSSQ